MSSLENKNVVVIGGTAGIGWEICRLAAEAGAKVWAAGRSQQYIDRAKQQAPANVQFVSVDIHDVDALKKLFEQVGTIDHLIANATGANRTIAPFVEQSAEQFSEAFGKFWGYTNVVRVGFPFVSKSGSITLTSGFPARKCPPGMSSLGCVGAAVENLCRAIAPEIAPVRINVVAPGVIDTSMYDWMGADKAKNLGARTAQLPINRPGTAEEVARAFMYLMQADYVTGTVMDVEGGMLLP